LPRFLLDTGEAEPAAAEIADALRLTGFFWERRVFEPHGRKLPAARTRFVDRLGRKATHSRAMAANPNGSK
jgi:hypothetical protein